MEIAVEWDNPFDHEITINEATSSCGCLKILDYQDRVAAKARASLRLEWVPQWAGQFDYSVVLQIGGRNSVLLLTFPAIVPAIGKDTVDDEATRDVLIRPEQLRARLADRESLILIDVRPRVGFLLGHIPGALNLPMHEVRARSFLRRRPIVILGDGHDDDVLARDALELVHLGFTEIKLLEGGLRAWKRSAGDLEGVAPHSAEVFEIPIEAAYRAFGNPEWLVISIENGNIGQPPIENPGLDIVRIPRANLTVDLLHVLEARPSIRRILFVSGGHAEFEAELSSSRVPPWFYLAGGWSAVRQYKDWRAAQGQRRTMSIGSVGSSATGARRSPPKSASCCGGR